MPFQAAGFLIEPPVSSPMPKAAIRVAIAVAGPPPDPPATRVKSYGFLTGPKSEFFCDVVIIDANDIGIRVEGSSRGVDRSWACGVFADNPLGQSREQTPMAIVRAAS
jgi:asparagine synthase (glutamine-hydrolysing)